MNSSDKGREGKGKCDWCGEPLGEVYFTDKKTKKSFHFSMNGKDCLSEFYKFQEPYAPYTQ